MLGMLNMAKGPQPEYYGSDSPSLSGVQISALMDQVTHQCPTTYPTSIPCPAVQTGRLVQLKYRTPVQVPEYSSVALQLKEETA